MAEGSSEGDLSQEQFAKDEELARMNGFDVIRSDDHTLLLDLDGAEALRRYTSLLPWVMENGIVTEEIETWESGSPGHYHVMLKLPGPLDLGLRLMLQAALGSDPKKEILSMLRFDIGIDEPCRLWKSRQMEIDHG